MSETRLYAVRNVEQRPCVNCGAVLPYWTRSDGQCRHGRPHTLFVVEEPGDAPAAGEPCPLVDVPDAWLRETWNLSAFLRTLYRGDA